MIKYFRSFHWGLDSIFNGCFDYILECKSNSDCTVRFPYCIQGSCEGKIT